MILYFFFFVEFLGDFVFLDKNEEFQRKGCGDSGYRYGDVCVLRFMVVVVMNLGDRMKLFDCFLLKRERRYLVKGE